MKKPRSMSLFGIQCVRCAHEIIAPHKTELLDDKTIRHVWHCPSCMALFEVFSAISEECEISKGSNNERRCFSAAERNIEAGLDALLFYLLLAGGGEEPVAAGGASIMARANASMAIFKVPFSRFRILNQLPCMVLSLTATE